MAQGLKQVTATGDVVAGDSTLYSVVLTGDGTNLATLDVRDGAGTAIRLTLRVLATGQSVVWTCGDGEGVYFASAVHATITGTGAVATFEYSAG